MSKEILRPQNKPAPVQQEQNEFELRGMLATLLCWHRLTQAEQEDLLRFAAAQPEQEPVGKFAKFTDGIWREVTDGSAGVPLYTTPPQRTWVGLTDEEVDDAARYCVKSGQSVNAAIRAIEAKLKEKNT